MCPPSASEHPSPAGGRVSWDMAAFTGFVLLVASLNAIVLIFGGPICWTIQLVVRESTR